MGDYYKDQEERKEIECYSCLAVRIILGFCIAGLIYWLF